jgi:hypothetical protein
VPGECRRLEIYFESLRFPLCVRRWYATIRELTLILTTWPNLRISYESYQAVFAEGGREEVGVVCAFDDW